MSECIKNNLDMSKISSMKTGGIAKTAYYPDNVDTLTRVIDELESNNERYYVLGNLSNVLVPDGTVDFVPVITTGLREYKVTAEDSEYVEVFAQCGMQITRLAYEMSSLGYTGLEFAYGIPGTVGGAVFMNAGAYGGEIKDVAQYVDFYDINSGEIIRIDQNDCNFGYRSSAFQNMKVVILGVCLKLKKGNAEESLDYAKSLMKRRMDKQPLEYPSCGSVFKRPVGYFAGDLIEKSGLKGKRAGGAEVSDKHAGFIVNRNNATTNDVVELIEYVKETVFQKHGVVLETEIRILE